MKSHQIACLVSLFAASVVACGAAGSGTYGENSGPKGPEGVVGMTVKINMPKKAAPKNRFNPDIAIGGGEQLNLVAWSVSGPNSYSGSANITSNQSFLIGSVGVGSGYSVSLTGTTSDGKVTCAGNDSAAPFSVTANTVTQASVTVDCVMAVAGDAGAIEVTTTATACDTLNYVSALQTTVARGGSTTIYLNGTGFGSDPVVFAASRLGGNLGTTVPTLAAIPTGTQLTNIDANDSSFIVNCPAGSASSENFSIYAVDWTWTTQLQWNASGCTTGRYADFVITCL